MKNPDIKGLIEALDNKPPAKEKGGFFDLPKQEFCTHPDHTFPTHLYIPPGKGYTHVCPNCGASQTVHNPMIY